MLGKGIVATVVSRYGHDGTCAIACQHVFGYPDGYFLFCKRIDGIRTREHTRHLVVHLAVALCTLLHIVEVFLYFLFLFRGGQLCHEVALRSQHHERHTEHRIGTGGEDGEVLVRVSHLEFHFRTLASAYPVALGFLQRVGPVYLIQSVQQALGIGRDAQTPLAHLLLHHRIAASHADAVYHLVVSQYGA